MKHKFLYLRIVNIYSVILTSPLYKCFHTFSHLIPKGCEVEIMVWKRPPLIAFQGINRFLEILELVTPSRHQGPYQITSVQKRFPFSQNRRFNSFLFYFTNITTQQGLRDRNLATSNIIMTTYPHRANLTPNH